MALDAVVFPQDPFTYGFNNKDYLYSLVAGGGWNHNYGFQTEEQEKLLLGIINNDDGNNIEQHANWDSFNSTSLMQNVTDHRWDSHSSPEACCTVDQYSLTTPPFPPLTSPNVEPTTGRRKRRRTKTAKNKEEIENQRMTHIAVERNRRKQMNEYLAVLRSLMPSSYVQRGDQASIIGGAINFVKELEQVLQSMEGQKRTKQPNESNIGLNGSLPFTEFFTFPQYTTRESAIKSNCTMQPNQWGVADIEVTMVDSHANLKILSKKQPGQLLKIVVGLQNLRFTILHLNVTTLLDMVLYSVSIKVEDGCDLNTVDEIAGAVNQLLRTVQEEVI
ncbi:hypothetical protein RJT34_09925 [Clitoria ternatea]|uniref:BHLH domain-containing protein n=1 Tax=Clitoria ternatea TaxID=43366 RepID=A0AAN9K6A5_CLITE